MKLWIALFAAGLAVAAVAFVTDSPVLLIVSVVVFAAVVAGVFLLGLRLAQQKGWLTPYLVALAAGIAVAAVAVAAIVNGASGDAPGLVLLGIALIVSDLIGLFTLGLRKASWD